jgi:hypothetical protein
MIPNHRKYIPYYKYLIYIRKIYFMKALLQCQVLLEQWQDNIKCVHDACREEVVAKQLLMVNPSYLIMVGSCCFATTIIGGWH